MDNKNKTLLIVILVLVALVVIILLITLIPKAGQQKPVCGNGKCELGEDPVSCPQDCKTGGLVCGDGKCEGAEADNTTQWYCPQDCKPIKCGNNICESDETWQTCNQDCCAPENAGANKELSCCQGLKLVDTCYGPMLMPCPGMHFYCTKCGNGICAEHETQWNCPEDCKSPANITRGVEGFVTLTQGDCMPPITSKCNKTFISTKVNVYNAVKENEMSGVYFKIIRTPVATTTSDSNGYYRLELSNGLYSVMVIDPLNSTVGDYCNSRTSGYACLINVTNKVIRLDIDVDHATH